MPPPRHRQPIHQRHTDSTEEATAFGAWLRQRRRALDWTQAELAQRVGCARVTIRRIEADDLKPSHQLAELLAEQLGVPLTQRKTWLQFARGIAPYPHFNAASSPVILAATPPTNLPTPLTTFLGREPEIARGRHLLATNRLLTFTGVGGTGKTRLVLEIARSILDSDRSDNPQSLIPNLPFPDGIWWVELASLRDAALIPRLIATVLGLREQPGQPIERLLAETLKTKQMLLLLDNCEHLVGECAGYNHQWLYNSPRLHIVATSREPLQLQGEQRLPVAPLAPAPAGELFVQRAQLVDPAFLRTPNNGEAIDQLCEQVDYLPLAIELLAARSDLFSPQAMLERLHARPLDLLSTGLRDLPARQRTLRHTIQHSYDLLTQREQSLFRTLGVFVGGFDLVAVAHFGFGEDVIHALLQKSLIRPAPLEQRGHRFFLLETLREYAREQLSELDELAEQQQQHAAYYCALAQRAEPNLFGAEQDAWAQQLETELGNLRAALTWWQGKDGEAALQMANALWFFWFMRDHLEEGRQWLESLAHRAAGTVVSRAKATVRAAACAKFQGDFERMAALATIAATLARTAGDKLMLGHALMLLGNAAHRPDEYAREQALYEEALALFQAAELPPGYFTGIVCENLGHSAEYRQDFDQAAGWLEESLRLRQQSANGWMMQYSYFSLGRLEHSRGNLDRAVAYYEAGLALTQKAGNKNNTAWVMYDLATVLFQQGKHEQAVLIFTESLKLGRDLFNKQTAEEALIGLATIARHQNQYAQAEAYLTESLTYAEQRNDRLWCTLIRHTLAYLALLQGQHSEAAVVYQACMVEWQKLAKPLWIASALRGFSMIAHARTQPERALCLAGAEVVLRQAHSPALGFDADIHWSPAEQYDWEQTVLAARAQLDAASAAHIWATGQAMTLDAAVAYALAGDQE